MYKLYFKRFFDFSGASIALTVASPFLLIAMAALKAANKNAGIFFVQQRPGKNGKIFKVIKFKTMNDKRDSEGRLLPDEVRLTRVGQIVRSMSIDELPQLINVLKGDMSFIGPRPLLVQYLTRYSAFQARRHEVRPGMSGWAQIHGRNNISWDKKLNYDVWYVDHLTLQTDLKILFLTIKKVFLREDINSANAATMEEFMGSQTEKQ